MLVRGKVLLAILLTGVANAATPIKEIQEDVVNGEQEVSSSSRGLQSRYGAQPNYPGAKEYVEAKKYVAPEPTPKPSTYTAPTENGDTTYRGTVYTDDEGRTYVIRKRNGVEHRVYTDTPGWNQQSRYRQRNGGTRVRNGNGNRVRNGNGNRRKWGGGGARPARKKNNNAWSPPTPAKEDVWTATPTNRPTYWRPDGWRPIPTYQGNYNPSYRKTAEPTYPEPTMVPTWGDDGYDGKCVEPFKSACCDQKSYYSLDQKQSLCKKMGCDYNDCDSDRKWGSAWGSAPDPTAMPTWETDGHKDPTAMPTWETDAWDGDSHKDKDEECSGAAREACCSQWKGDEWTKSEMCERLGCDWNKCQKGTDSPTKTPSATPSVSVVPTWSADGWTGDTHDDDWTGDGECSKEEQDRCCSQSETKSLEVQSKICKNKFGCSVFKCPQNRKGDDGWYGDSFEGLDWDGDGNDVCSAEEQDKCCDQHDGISITKQQQICKNMWDCSLLKCSKHRQSDAGYDEDKCSKDDMVSCCGQHPSKPFDLQYSFCNKLGCNIHSCDIGWYEEDKDRCTEDEHYKCCNQSGDIAKGTQHENCLKSGCSLFECNYEDEDEDMCTAKEQYKCCHQSGDIAEGTQQENCLEKGCSLFDCTNYEDEPDDTYNKKWDNGDKPKFQLGYGGDDSTCPDSSKWKCCNPSSSISGSYKSIVKNCQDLGCEWGMCPQNRDNKLYDDQGYYDSYYEYGGGYNKDDKCTDGGKWKCCNPDESLTGLKAWVRNCQANSCEWEKCPHHRQGYYDPMDQTYEKSPTSSPIQKCTMKEQYKCCNYQGTLKEAAKYCQDLDCDISDCNDHSGGWNTNGYHAGGWPDFGGYDNYGGGYNNGPPPYDGGYIGDKPQGNKGPNPNTSDYSNNDSDWRQGNTGPRPDAENRDNDSNNGDRPQGNKGPRDGRDGGSDGGFLDQGLDSNCTREFTAGGACREVCKETVEYKLMGIVMSTHEETTTRECS